MLDRRETRIKICGITTPEDARLSLSHGADYLGLIFVDSARRVTIDTAKGIRRAVPRAMLVGVFADTPVEDVAETCRSCGLDMVQLHGSESPAYCDSLASRISLPAIKVFTSRQLFEADRIAEYRTAFFLLDLDKDDASSAAAVNGSREALWKRAAGLRRKGYRIFLAGKLNETNVANAVASVEPYCIDVASGVEKSPGVKDAAALSRFVREVRR